MDLKKYFTETEGVGVLSTADTNGRVNGAIYARPHLLDDGCISFIMRDRLTRSNLQGNPHAHYLFMEKGKSYSGIRLYLEKEKEVEDQELIARLSRRSECTRPQQQDPALFLVSFRINKTIGLLGDNEIELD